MPVEFLSDEQAATYGRFTAPPSQAELERYFFLDDADKTLIAKRRSDHSKLGFGLQLVTVRYLGTFLTDPLDVPTVVLDYIAGQLGIAEDPLRVSVGDRPRVPVAALHHGPGRADSLDR